MHCFLAFLAGVLLFSLFAYFPCATAFILFCIVLTLLGKRKYLVIPVLVAGILYAFIRCGPAIEISCSNDRYSAQGIFTTFPVRTKSGLIRQSFLIERAENQRTGEPANALTGKEIMILAGEGSSPYTEYLAEIRISGIGTHRNPGEYGEQPVIAYLAAISGPGSTKEPLFAHIQEFRYRVNEYLTGRFDRETGAFLASVTTGEQAYIDEAVRDAFNTTGLTHILSISGSHFGLFSVVLYTLFRMLIALLPYRALQRITLFLTPSQGAAILCFPFVLAYLGISGASIPAIRSFIMITFFLLGLIIGKKNSWLVALVFAAVLLVVWNTETIFSLSFQLSFIAVLCIGFSMKMGKHGEEEERKPFRSLRNAGMITLAASIGTAPLVAYHFHYFSIIAPATNLLIAPLIGFLIIPLSVFSAFLFPVTGDFIFAPVLAPVTGFLLSLVKLTARMPYADIPVPAFPPVLLLLFYAGFAVFLLFRQRRCLFILPFIPFLLYGLLSLTGSDGIKITFLDVGQGDSSVLELPDGKTIVIDTGKSGRETASYLRYRGKRTVDALVLTHVHPDHTGGLGYLGERIDIMEIWYNGRMKLPEGIAHISQRALERGDVLEGDGYTIQILHPYAEFYSSQRSGYVEANNDSLVLKISGHRAFLFSGDIEQEAEENILQLGGWLRSDVLKVPHHGSRNSAHGSLFRAISPAAAVISAGRCNSFGHPHQEMLAALEGISVYRTDMDGAVRMEDCPDGLRISTYRDFQIRRVTGFSEELKNMKALFTTW
ncbi:MAG: DNA internalization-related competence protein ComEC/Rec2 [Thermodesulfovibrionales bacterium]|nr:DNA internalization-related competence protein ComEC/Rec2 [Thermodesulfovibrionales bacterium]